MIDRITEKIVPIASKIQDNKYLSALRDGFMAAFPATMFASICMIIQYLPATFGFDQFLPAWVMTFLNDFFGPVGNATMAVSSIFICFGVAYHLAGKIDGNKLFSGIVALTSFFMLLPFHQIEEGTFMPVVKLGSQGMFVAIFTAFAATLIFNYFEKKDITIKMPPQVPAGIAKSFIAIIPSAITLIVFNILRYGFTVTPWGNVFDFLFSILQQPLTHLGSSLPATLVAVVAAQLLWWFGVHGQAVVNTVMDPLWGAMALENYVAYQAGQALPHIVNSTFMGIFPLIGGNGMTLGIVLLSLFMARSARLKSTMKMVAAPSFFNISEPITFGLPVVMNPMVFIPWVVAPVVTVTISYLAIAAGIVPRPIGITVVWTTPVFLSGWIGTGSIMGGLLQLVNLTISTLIWFPFIKALDKSYLKEEEIKEAKEEEDDEDIFDLD